MPHKKSTGKKTLVKNATGEKPAPKKAKLEPLDPDQLVDDVIQSTPFPGRFTGDASTCTLGTLGVTGGTAGGFVANVQSKIKPWLIDSSDVPTAGNTTVQTCALAINNNAKAPK